MPCELPQPRLVPAAVPALGEAGGVRAAPVPGVPTELFPARAFPVPGLCCPGAAGGSRWRSEHGARRHLTSCVQANLSFFFHYLGMYCHLIFMYAILPDKYDLLPGNSSDVHSVPRSNYGSVAAAAPGAAEPLLHLSAGSGLPDALSCQSAASKYNQRQK